MTVEQLIGATPEEQAAMTDAQLLEYFKPVLHITRPELAAKPESNGGPKKAGLSSATHAKQAEISAMLKKMGMTLPGF